MRIIDDECIACSCFESCGTEVMKGSIICNSKRMSAKQTKADMYRRMNEGSRCRNIIGSRCEDDLK